MPSHFVTEQISLKSSDLIDPVEFFNLIDRHCQFLSPSSLGRRHLVGGR